MAGVGNDHSAYVIKSTNEVIGFDLAKQSYFIWDESAKEEVRVGLTEEQVDKKISDHKNYEILRKTTSSKNAEGIRRKGI